MKNLNYFKNVVCSRKPLIIKSTVFTKEETNIIIGVFTENAY